MSVALLVGRPNVGKSTLFNKLTRTRAALVDDREGVTRDWIERPWELPGGSRVLLRDLCGFRENEDDPVLRQSQEQMQQMLSQADLLLFVVDAREGVTEMDRWVANQIRHTGKPVVLVANKAESIQAEQAAYTTAELGWQPLPVSAEHNIGLGELEDAAIALLGDYVDAEADSTELDVAILGKPNAGKSTLLNRLLGEHRATVSDVAGTTRDPVDAYGQLAGRPVRFVDTAGIRRRRSIHDQLEAATVSRSIQAARDADIILYLIQAEDGITQQDQVLLSKIVGGGQGILLLLSQWDKIEDGEARFQHLQAERDRLLPFLDFAPMLTISGLSGANVSKIERWVADMADQLDREIPTSKLNDALTQILAQNPPPSVQIRTSRRSKRHKPLKLYYATQSGTRPLRFKMFSNVRDKDLPDSYRRYLNRKLRAYFDIEHVPVLLHFEDKPND